MQGLPVRLGSGSHLPQPGELGGIGGAESQNIARERLQRGLEVAEDIVPTDIQVSRKGSRRLCLSLSPWPPSFSYRTVVRPSYKVMYKTVTAREWRCCPGHSGVNCEEGRTP